MEQNGLSSSSLTLDPVANNVERNFVGPMILDGMERDHGIGSPSPGTNLDNFVVGAAVAAASNDTSARNHQMIPNESITTTPPPTTLGPFSVQQIISAAMTSSNNFTGYTASQYINSTSSITPTTTKNCSLNPIISDESPSSFTMVVDLAGEYPLDQATILFGYITPFVVLLSIVTNLFVVAVLTRRHMRTGTNIILCTLSFVDLLTILIGSPWYFYIYTLGHYKENLNWFTCYSHSVFIEGLPVFLHNASIWLTVLLAGQRYFCIRYPVLACRWCTKPRIKQSIGLIILVAFVSQLTRFFDNEFEFDVECNQCRRRDAKWVLWFGIDFYFGTYFSFRILFVYLIPCVSLVTLNCLLYLALKRAERKRTELLRPRYELEEVGWNVTVSSSDGPRPTSLDDVGGGCCLMNENDGLFLLKEPQTTSTTTNEMAAIATTTARTTVTTKHSDTSTSASCTLLDSTNNNKSNNKQNKDNTARPEAVGVLDRIVPSGQAKQQKVKLSSSSSFLSASMEEADKKKEGERDQDEADDESDSCRRLKWADPIIGKSGQAGDNGVVVNGMLAASNEPASVLNNNSASGPNHSATSKTIKNNKLSHKPQTRQEEDKNTTIDPHVLTSSKQQKPPLVHNKQTKQQPEIYIDEGSGDLVNDDEEDDDEEEDDYIDDDEEPTEVMMQHQLTIGDHSIVNKSNQNNNEYSNNNSSINQSSLTIIDDNSERWSSSSCLPNFCSCCLDKLKTTQEQVNYKIKDKKEMMKIKRNKSRCPEGGPIRRMHQDNSTTTSNNITHAGKIAKRRPRRVRDSNRTTLMLIVVVTVYLVIEIPSAIVTTLHTIASAFNEDSDENDFVYNLTKYTKLYSNFLIIISYSINFSIYCSMSKKFRITFRDLLTCKKSPAQRLISISGNRITNLNRKTINNNNAATGKESLYTTSPNGSRSLTELI